MKILLIVSLLISLITNIFLFNENLSLNKKNEVFNQQKVYSKAQKDIEDFFEPEKKVEQVKSVEIKEVKRKKVFLQYGIFATEYFLNKNVERFKNQGLPLSLKESKKGTILLIGPVGINVAKKIMEDTQAPKDIKVIDEK